MSQPKNLTLVEHNYYHLRASMSGPAGDVVDYLFTTSQLEVARERASDKKHLLPPPPPPAADIEQEEPRPKRSWFFNLFSGDK